MSRDTRDDEVNPYYPGANKIEEELRAALSKAQTKTEKYAVKIVDLKEKVEELEEVIQGLSDKAFECAEAEKKLSRRIYKLIKWATEDGIEYDSDARDMVLKIVRDDRE